MKKYKKLPNYLNVKFVTLIRVVIVTIRHLLTPKHEMAKKRLTNTNKKVPESTYEIFRCDNCDKIYKHQSSLCKHKKICKKNETNNDKLVEYLMKENSELKNIIIETCKNLNSSSINNNSNSFNNNKTFNLQFFLNETCKDAMNIMDFVDSIKLQLSDLEKVGELGYVEGISNIIVKNLKEMDITERPVHCTDSKRETLYVKDEDKWEKENENKNKLKKVIKRVANKNINMLQEFKTKYPDCIYSDSKKSDQYNKIIIEAFKLDDIEKNEKIIKNISKEVKIDKTL